MQFVLALVLAFLPIGYSQESDEPDLGKKLQVLQTGNVDQQLEVLGSFHVKLLLDEVQESPRAISVIQPFLMSGNADIRAAAVIAFASVGGTRSRILQLCRDKEPTVRAAAVEAFLEAGGDPCQGSGRTWSGIALRFDTWTRISRAISKRPDHCWRMNRTLSDVGRAIGSSSEDIGRSPIRQRFEFEN